MRNFKLNIHNYRLKTLISSFLVIFLLSACMSKEAQYSDQQKRMQRCDQYIGQSRDDCLNGMTVTIEDYKQDWREFERDQAKQKAQEQEAAKKNAPIINVPKPKKSEEKDTEKSGD